MSNPPLRRPRRAELLLELGAVAAFATLYLTLGSGRPRFVDVLVGAAAVAAIALDAGRTRRLWDASDAEAPGSAPRSDPRAGWLAAGAFTAAALVVLAVLGLCTAGADAIVARFGNWHLLPAIALYFPWAYLQQFLFQFYLLPRLLRLLPAPVAVVATGLGFAAVHYPRWPVMAATACAGVVWALIYRRHRRLLPLAASHAMLGPALHYWVLGRDLLAGWLR